jgi:uncharacterized membrane protein YhaH (DUF805 family)
MPGGYFFTALAKWTDYRSRARRAEFWMYLVVAWLIDVFALAITAMVVNPAFDSHTYTLDTSAMTTLGWICIGVTVALALVLFFPFLAVSVRRMHDLGRSGGWVLFLFVLPIVVWLMALFDGQPMTNKYGPDPKGRG